MARELVVPWSSARMKGMAGIVLPPEGRTQSAKGVRVDAHNSHAPRCPTHEVNDEKDHKQRQQNVDRADGYVESEKADQPCDEEQERDCQPHTKSLQRRSIELLCLGRMAKEIEGLLGSAACSGKRADPCTSYGPEATPARSAGVASSTVARFKRRFLIRAATARLPTRSGGPHRAARRLCRPPRPCRGGRLPIRRRASRSVR